MNLDRRVIIIVMLNNHSEDSTFTAIFTTSKEGFIQFAYSYLGNMEEAEDAVMESYVQYWEVSQRTDKVIRDAKAYIFMILRNKCIDLLEAKKQHLQHTEVMYDQMVGEIELNITSLQCCDPSELFSKDITRIVTETIDNMPDRTREIFYERYYEQKSYKSIAEAFGISVKGVEFHMTKCLRVLRERLKDYL